MIRVTIELISARTGKTEKLGEMHICNTGESTDPNVSDYHGRVLRKPKFNTVTNEAQVWGHRRNSLTVWHLVAKMLKHMKYVD